MIFKYDQKGREREKKRISFIWLKWKHFRFRRHSNVCQKCMLLCNKIPHARMLGQLHQIGSFSGCFFFIFFRVLSTLSMPFEMKEYFKLHLSGIGFEGKINELLLISERHLKRYSCFNYSANCVKTAYLWEMKRIVTTSTHMKMLPFFFFRSILKVFSLTNLVIQNGVEKINKPHCWWPATNHVIVRKNKRQPFHVWSRIVKVMQ